MLLTNRSIYQTYGTHLRKKTNKQTNKQTKQNKTKEGRRTLKTGTPAVRSPRRSLGSSHVPCPGTRPREKLF